MALFLRSHLEALPDSVTPVVFTNTQDSYAHLAADMELHHLSVGRAPRITRADLVATISLTRELRRRGIRTVITVSPKAGFVGQVAATMARVPQRAHIFTGQVWADMPRSVKRWMTRSADRVIARLATSLAADSPSQAQFLLDERVVPRGKHINVPHSPGSIRGVDLATFAPDSSARKAVREAHGISPGCVAFVQLGRLTRAKGVPELVDAFGRLRDEWRLGALASEPRLVLVGPDEEELSTSIGHRDGIDVLAFTPEPQRLLTGMDVLVLASHREGFGSTVIEAAAIGLPAIGTDIVGVRDALVPGSTGWLVPPGSARGLYEAMKEALVDEAERARRGRAALDRVRVMFPSARVATAYAQYVLSLHERRR